jgi:ABC-type uncharacterized transport system substrate-binding protein
MPRPSRPVAFACGLVGLVLTLGPVETAGQRRPTIALVLVRDVPAFAAARDGLVAELPQTEVVELEPDLADARAAIEALRSQSPDVVVALGSSAALAVSEYLPQTPLGLVLQPDALEGVRSARVGYTLAVLPAARLVALERVFSPLKHVAVLCRPDGRSEADALRKAGAARGIRVDVLQAPRAAEIARALDGLEVGTQVLLLTTDPLFLREDVGRAVVMQAFERRVPVVGFSEKTVRVGGLAALEIDYRSNGAELARAALSVFAGREPSYRVSESSQLHWVVNAQAAKSLGITVPPGLLAGVGGDAVAAEDLP